MDRKKALSKIKKCLAMAASNSEHEAAAAMRQARALMDQFSLTDDDVLAAEIEEVTIKGKSAQRVPLWQEQLGSVVSGAFGVKLMWRYGGVRMARTRVVRAPGCFVIVGRPPATEVAKYAMEVLLRHAHKARSDYCAGPLKGRPKAEKTRRCDLYSLAWVVAVRKQVDAFAQPCRDAAAIEAYMLTHYPAIEPLKSVNRHEDLISGSKKLSGKDLLDIRAGNQAASSVHLVNGVHGTAKAQEIGLTRQLALSGGGA